MHLCMIIKIWENCSRMLPVLSDPVDKDDVVRLADGDLGGVRWEGHVVNHVALLAILTRKHTGLLPTQQFITDSQNENTFGFVFFTNFWINSIAHKKLTWHPRWTISWIWFVSRIYLSKNPWEMFGWIQTSSDKTDATASLFDFFFSIQHITACLVHMCSPLSLMFVVFWWRLVQLTVSPWSPGAWWRTCPSSRPAHHTTAPLGPLCTRRTWCCSAPRPCTSPWQRHPRKKKKSN